MLPCEDLVEGPLRGFQALFTLMQQTMVLDKVVHNLGMLLYSQFPIYVLLYYICHLWLSLTLFFFFKGVLPKYNKNNSQTKYVFLLGPPPNRH